VIIKSLDDVTRDALAAMTRTDDPRLREILTALVGRLHAFVREVRLTEAEFRAATGVINQIGRLSTDSHNEAVLMAGSLGVSSLVCLLNNGVEGSAETSQSLLGPFWRLNSPRVPNGGSILRGPTPGEPLFVKGHVVDPSGAPVEGADVDVWHASPVGLYENQDPDQAEMNLRGKLTTDTEGRFWFSTVMMVGYPIPTDGVVGRLLTAQNRQPKRPAHLHALIVKPGYKVLVSQVYDPEDPNLEDDPQFGVTRALIGAFVRHDEPHPTDPSVRLPWRSLEHTYVMQPGETVLPQPPIK
jgi:catechol 1,2-dioxygenase